MGTMRVSRLLAHDVDLLACVTDPEQRRFAREAVVVKELDLASGERLDLVTVAPQASLGLLVLSGFLAREISITTRISAELVGPEDFVSPEYLEPPGSLFEHGLSWVALGPTRLALLGDDFREQVRAWPEILCALVERARRAGDRASLGRAIGRFATVEARLLMLLWHWASSWSVVTPEGVRLAVPLSHERLARLIGASRPTVTTAIGRLRQAGYLGQCRDGHWLLLEPHESRWLEREKLPILDMTRLRDLRTVNGRAELDVARKLANSKRPELYARLAEQRELLRVAADRHNAELIRLRDSSDQLRTTTRLSRLARRERTCEDDHIDAVQRTV